MSNITQTYISNLLNYAGKMSTLQLCRIIDVAPANFYKWKNGKVNITMETASKQLLLLSKHFQVDLKLPDFVGIDEGE